MTETATNAALRRKTSRGRREHEARGMSAAKALRLALARAAADLFDLPLAASGVAEQTCLLDPLLERIPEGALTILLDGPGGSPGVFAVDAAFLASVIEIQTTGRVGTAAPAARRLTATDAAMLSPLVEGVLTRLGANLAIAVPLEAGAPPEGSPAGGRSSELPVEAPEWASGFRFGAQIEGIGALGLALTATEFRTFHLTVDIAGGARRGEMVLALPVPPERPVATSERIEEIARPGRFEADFLNVEAEVEGVLCTLIMPLAEAGALKTGDVLELPAGAVAGAWLRAGDGRPVGHGRLGRLGGMWALRFAAPAGSAGAPPAAALMPDALPGPDASGAGPAARKAQDGSGAPAAGDSTALAKADKPGAGAYRLPADAD